MNSFNINQKFLFLDLINKYLLPKIKSYKLKHQLNFKLIFNLKIIAVHFLILKFFSLNKSIILKKSKSNIIRILTQNFNKYTIKFLTKLNLETLFTTNKIVVNKTFLTFNLKNYITLSKLEIFYIFLKSNNSLNINVFINGTFSNKILVYIFRKLLLNI